MTRLNRFVAVIVAAAATAAIGYASRAPLALQAAEHGRLRLSWRLRGAREEVCRNRTQAELDALPVHMRTPQVCTGHNVAYRLVVKIDGSTDTLHYEPAGAKGDRAIFVLHEEPLEPGSHNVSIIFEPTTPGVNRRALYFNERFDIRAGQIALVTVDPGASRLLLVR